MAKRTSSSKGETEIKKTATRAAGKTSKPKASNRRKITAKASKKVVDSDNGNGPMPEKPMPKTRMKAEELEEFKQLLLQTRGRLSGDLVNMQDEAFKKNRSDACGDLSMMPIHMADIGTDNYEQEFTIGLIENEQQVLKEIDAALLRIENRTFGICEATRKPIRKARLRAKPWARFCVEYKREHEHGHQNNNRRSAF